VIFLRTKPALQFKSSAVSAIVSMALSDILCGLRVC
jgi:hypothetical protein